MGAISFEISDQTSRGDNLKHILKICKERKIDLLVCSGWTVLERRDIDTLNQEIKNIFNGNGRRPGVVLETSHDPETFYLHPDGGILNMGKQIFATANDLSGDKGNQLADAIQSRCMPFPHDEDMKMFLLCCGEINVLSGRNNVIFHSNVPQKLIDALTSDNTIILNPTHDRFGNGGTIKEKRKFLSKGINNYYLSVSNWNIHKKNNEGQIIRQKISKTIHTFFQNGDEIEASYKKGSEADFYYYTEYEM